MGACLCKSKDDSTQAVHRRDTSRKRSACGSRLNCGGSNHHTTVMDFGVSSVYRVMELLGEGGTGQTWLCQDLRSHMRVAVKFIPRPLAKVLVPMVSQEIQLQAQLSEGHVGLVRVEAALLSKSHLGLVMEYVDGGTLTQYVTKRAPNKGERGGLHLNEDEARYFFRQLISAVEYLHASHVAHRDLKMCNVVLTQRRPPTLKLCDFGFAKGWDDSSIMHTRIGTPVYMSPQLIASKNEGKAYRATAADVWACGVMLFAMLVGKFPYDHAGHPNPNSSGAHIEVLNEQMKLSNGDWLSAPRVAPHVNLLSEECKDLLGKMLDTDEERRIHIPDIRKHIWFTKELPPHLDDALKDVEERQARLARVMEAAKEEQIKRRNKAVHDLIVMAGQPHNVPLHKRAASGAFSAIFEGGTDCDAGSVTSLGNMVTSQPRTITGPVPPVDVVDGSHGASTGGGGGDPAGNSDLLQPPLSPVTPPPQPANNSIDGGCVEPEVIFIELAAVAKRTKSDGLVLMASFAADGTEGGGVSCAPNCDSEESDPAMESDCATGSNGAATATAATAKPDIVATTGAGAGSCCEQAAATAVEEAGTFNGEGDFAKAVLGNTYLEHVGPGKVGG